MSPRGILVTEGKPPRRVLRKVRVHHLFFLDDPLPEHQEIEGKTNHEDEPGPHDECQAD